MIAGVIEKPKLSLDKTIPLNTSSSATGVIIPKRIIPARRPVDAWLELTSLKEELIFTMPVA